MARISHLLQLHKPKARQHQMWTSLNSTCFQNPKVKPRESVRLTTNWMIRKCNTSSTCVSLCAKTTSAFQMDLWIWSISTSKKATIGVIRRQSSWSRVCLLMEQPHSRRSSRTTCMTGRRPRFAFESASCSGTMIWAITKILNSIPKSRFWQKPRKTGNVHRSLTMSKSSKWRPIAASLLTKRRSWDPKTPNWSVASTSILLPCPR